MHLDSNTVFCVLATMVSFSFLIPVGLLPVNLRKKGSNQWGLPNDGDEGSNVLFIVLVEDGWRILLAMLWLGVESGSRTH